MSTARLKAVLNKCRILFPARSVWFGSSFFGPLVRNSVLSDTQQRLLGWRCKMLWCGLGGHTHPRGFLRPGPQIVWSAQGRTCLLEMNLGSCLSPPGRVQLSEIASCPWLLTQPREWLSRRPPVHSSLPHSPRAAVDTALGNSPARSVVSRMSVPSASLFHSSFVGTIVIFP